MSRKNYVYDNGKTHKERVNVYQLEKRVKALEVQNQAIKRHLQHQINLNQQQVLLNETLSDRVALLEKASWSKQHSAKKITLRLSLCKVREIAATLSVKVAIAWNTLSATFHKAKEKSCWQWQNSTSMI